MGYIGRGRKDTSASGTCVLFENMVEVLLDLPLASASVWIAIGAFQVKGQSYRISTGAAFTGTAFLLGIYALQDWLTLSFPLPDAGPGSFPPSHFYLVLASLTFFYFAKWLVHGRRWVDVFVALPAAFMALPYVVPSLPVLGAWWAAGWPIPFLAEGALTHYLVYALTMIVVGLLVLRQGASLALDAMGGESWAIIAIMGAAALMLAFALLTNPYFPVLQASPLFSATLVAPGVLLLLVLRWDRSSGVIQLFNLREAFQGETLAVYLIYKSGDLLGAAIGEDERMDEDVFAGTLDAFQSFFTRALPLLGGHALRTATFGDIAVVIERGEHCYLTVVTTSRRLGLIRELMKQRLKEFEASNASVLSDWSGVLDALEGTNIVLQGFLPEERAEGS